jgi:twitching motility protein PilT
MARLDAFFKVMAEQGASDMHLSVGAPPILRLRGTLKKADYPPADGGGAAPDVV